MVAKATPTTAQNKAGAQLKNTRQIKGNKRQKSQKKTVKPEERLKRLFNSLCAQIDGGHFKNALKTCDKILRINSDDEDAKQARLFLLLQSEDYDGALSHLTSTSSQDAPSFEKAYALYRQHKESEASRVITSLKEEYARNGEDNRGILHLEAQMNYRQGFYEAASNTYAQLLDTAPTSEEHADLLTNIQATQTHLDFMVSGFKAALDALPSQVANTLETAPPPAPISGASVPTKLANSATTTQVPTQPPQEKKPIRMSRLPKGVVLGVTPPPDPERWLKKSERSNFGQGYGKRKKTAGGGATQGSAVESAPAPSSKSSGAKSKKKR